MSQTDLNQLAMLFSPEEIKQMIASRNAVAPKLPIEKKTKVAKKSIVVKGRKPIVRLKKYDLRIWKKLSLNTWKMRINKPLDMAMLAINTQKSKENSKKLLQNYKRKNQHFIQQPFLFIREMSQKRNQKASFTIQEPHHALTISSEEW